MARPKSWIPRIGHILQYLESDTAEFYTRRDVEKLFSVSASQASEVMKAAGETKALRLGQESRVSRSNLIHYVRYSPEAQDALQEIERRKKLGKKLRQAEADLNLRKIRLRVTSDDEWTRFEDLPSVSVQPGEIRIAFTPGDPVDALDTMYRFIKAAGNEWEQFERMCGRPGEEKAS